MAPPVAWLLGAAICAGALRPIAGIVGKIFRGPQTPEEPEEQTPTPDLEPDQTKSDLELELDPEEEPTLEPIDEPLSFKSWCNDAPPPASESDGNTDGKTDEKTEVFEPVTFSFWPEAKPPRPESRPTVSLEVLPTYPQALPFWPLVACGEPHASPTLEVDHVNKEPQAHPVIVLETHPETIEGFDERSSEIKTILQKIALTVKHPKGERLGKTDEKIDVIEPASFSFLPEAKPPLPESKAMVSLEPQADPVSVLKIPLETFEVFEKRQSKIQTILKKIACTVKDPEGEKLGCTSTE